MVLLLFPDNGRKTEDVRWQFAGPFSRGMLLGIGLWFILTLGLELELWFGLMGVSAQGLGLDLDPKLQIPAGHVP